MKIKIRLRPETTSPCTILEPLTRLLPLERKERNLILAEIEVTRLISLSAPVKLFKAGTKDFLASAKELLPF